MGMAVMVGRSGLVVAEADGGCMKVRLNFSYVVSAAVCLWTVVTRSISECTAKTCTWKTAGDNLQETGRKIYLSADNTHPM